MAQKEDVYALVEADYEGLVSVAEHAYRSVYSNTYTRRDVVVEIAIALLHEVILICVDKTRKPETAASVEFDKMSADDFRAYVFKCAQMHLFNRRRKERSQRSYLSDQFYAVSGAPATSITKDTRARLRELDQFRETLDESRQLAYDAMIEHRVDGGTWENIFPKYKSHYSTVASLKKAASRIRADAERWPPDR